MKLSPTLLRVGMKLSDLDLLQTAEPFCILLLNWLVGAQPQAQCRAPGVDCPPANWRCGKPASAAGSRVSTGASTCPVAVLCASGTYGGCAAGAL
jgi:hypothetical protein